MRCANQPLAPNSKPAAARRLARTRGPVWPQLESRLSLVITDEELSRGFQKDALVPLIQTRDDALMALLHRSPEVRLAGCERLKEFVDDPSVANRLLYILFDFVCFVQC